MSTTTLQKFCKTIAILSLTGGLLVFFLYYISPTYRLLTVGLFYTGIAAVINVVVLIFFTVRAVKEKAHTRKLIPTYFFMLLNIPIALLLLWCVGFLMNTMRVTIVNSTNQDITDVIIDGCDPKIVGIIKAGSSKNVWINIPKECAITMSYKKGEARKVELISGYLSPSMGGKTTHQVGMNDLSGT